VFRELRKLDRFQEQIRNLKPKHKLRYLRCSARWSLRLSRGFQHRKKRGYTQICIFVPKPKYICFIWRRNWLRDYPKGWDTLSWNSRWVWHLWRGICSTLCCVLIVRTRQWCWFPLLKATYIFGIELGNNSIHNVVFIGSRWYAVNVNPIRVLSILPEIQIHVMRCMVHGGVFARIERSESVAEIIWNCFVEDSWGDFGSSDNSLHFTW